MKTHNIYPNTKGGEKKMIKYYIGMDLHKNTSSFTIKDKQGKLIDKQKIPTQPSSIKGYLRRFSQAQLTLEPVSQWYYYADLIQKLGTDVCLAHPMKVKAIASARIKTDDIDSK